MHLAGLGALDDGLGAVEPLDADVGATQVEEQLVGLDVEGGIVPSPGDCVRVGKAQVGEVTSAMKSPYLGKVIALARVATTHAEIGGKLEVGQLDGQQKRLKSTVVPFPHFDPGKDRVKGTYS